MKKIAIHALVIVVAIAIVVVSVVVVAVVWFFGLVSNVGMHAWIQQYFGVKLGWNTFPKELCLSSLGRMIHRGLDRSGCKIEIQLDEYDDQTIIIIIIILL